MYPPFREVMWYRAPGYSIRKGRAISEAYHMKCYSRPDPNSFPVFGSRKKDGVEESFIAQCKRTSSLGVKVALELLGVLAATPSINKGFLITSGEFTEECLRFAVVSPRLTLIVGITFANYLIQLKIV